MGELGADGGFQVIGDIPDGHAAGVEGDDHFIQPAGAARAFGHQGWGEGAGTIPGDLQVDIPGHRGHGLRVGAVAGVRQESSVGFALLVAQVAAQLGFQAAPVRRG